MVLGIETEREREIKGL